MILLTSLLFVLIGFMYAIKSKKIFDKGMSESDSYRMIVEFNKSKRYQKHATMSFIVGIIFLFIYCLQLIIFYGK